MSNIEDFIGIVARFILSFELAYYLITLLQWYNYSFYRIIFMHHKFMWHIWYFILPLTFSMILGMFNLNQYVIVVALVLFVALVIWRFKQDKPLRFTKRVQRFFVLCLIFVLLDEGLGILFGASNPFIHILPLIFAVVISNIYERVLFKQYKQIAKDKLEAMRRLKIIGVTASFGKTSIKNFLFQILSTHFNVYATPRSVNTLVGIVADINENLDYTTEIYIAEAGARLKGDIDEIVQFLNPQYAVIGEIGAQHLEYFKTLENIINTKFELLHSSRLRKAFIFEQNALPQNLDSHTKRIISFYPTGCRNISATLDGTNFELEYKEQWYSFETQILGAFNVYNIAAAVSVALEFGMRMADIQHSVSKLEPVPHRLQKIFTNQKLILDDSFNGNLKGMLEAARLASLYNGRKVVVTPGIVESTKEDNIELAKYLDTIFDIVIITGMLNAKIIRSHIVKAQKIIVENKESLEGILKACTLPGDIILFSNDAPSFI